MLQILARGAVEATQLESQCGAVYRTCFHACKAANGVQGTMQEGKVKGTLYDENDPDSGSGQHGFYARA